MKIGDTLYFDYQATTPVDPEVFEAMKPFFGAHFGNPHSSDHILGWQSQQAVERAQSQIASLLGADSDEIVFTSGATEANNLALFGVAKRAAGAKRRVLVSAIEHKCVLTAARALAEQYDIEIEIMPVDEDGYVDIKALESIMDEDVLLVSIIAVNNEIGTIQDLGAVSSIVKRHDALFHCDAAQAPVALDLDVHALDIDLLSLSAHKLYGPKGIGALFVAREARNAVEPLIYGGGQQDGLRSGTVPTPLCVGFGVAAQKLRAETEGGERHRIAALRNRFLEGLRDQGIPHELVGPALEHRHPGNANVRFPNVDAHALLGALQPRLAASTGAACTSGMPEPSHVLGAIGLSDAEASCAVRFSVGRFTEEAHVDEAVELLANTLAEVDVGTVVA